MTSLFWIVKFPDEGDSVAVVPSCWIQGEKCFWPPKSIETGKAAKKEVLPDPEAWELCKFAKVGDEGYSTYKEARSLLKDATETSDFENFRSLKRGRPSTKATGSKRPKLPEAPLCKSPETYLEPNDVNRFSIQNVQPDNVIPNTSEMPLDCGPPHALHQENYIFCPTVQLQNKSTDTDDLERNTVPITGDGEQIRRTLQCIKLTLVEHSEILNILLTKTCEKDSPESVNRPTLTSELPSVQFPLKDLHGVQELEDKLAASAGARSAMVNMLSMSGTGTLKNCLKKMLMRIFTDELTATFSLKGMKGKASLSTYECVKGVLSDAARLSPRGKKDITDDEIDKGLSDALKLAADRVNQRNRKSHPERLVKGQEIEDSQYMERLLIQ